MVQRQLLKNRLENCVKLSLIRNLKLHLIEIFSEFVPLVCSKIHRVVHVYLRKLFKYNASS